MTARPSGESSGEGPLPLVMRRGSDGVTFRWWAKPVGPLLRRRARRTGCDCWYHRALSGGGAA